MVKQLFENEYISVFSTEEGVTVAFSVDDEKPYEIGEQMRAVNENAYMNGYNWEVFLNYYIEKNYPGLLNGFETDPEAGGYFAYCDESDGGEQRAVELANAIVSLIEDPGKIFEFLKAYGEDIDWD